MKVLDVHPLKDGLHRNITMLDRLGNEMDEKKLGEIYQLIAETVIYTIPEEWTKIYLYGEIIEGAQKSYFFYYPENKHEPVYSHDIPYLFDMDKYEYKKLWHQLLDYLQDLWKEFKDNGQEIWSSMTMVFNNSGEIKIDYDYEDISEADPHERQIIWEHQYLELVPEDDSDKGFLENYLKTIEK